MSVCLPCARPLVVEDAIDLAALETLVFADAWDASHFAALLRRDHFFGVGVFRGSALCGYVTSYIIDGEVEIVNVAVRPQDRGQGLGTKVLAFFLDEARGRGMARALLEVRSTNRVALSLYARAGFRPAGIRPRYYRDTGEDAVILLREEVLCRGS